MKKRFLSVIIAAGILAGVTGCGTGSSSTAQNDGEYVLKIGEAQGALCHAPLQIAMEKGYLDAEGVKWERVDFGKGDIQAALGAGTIDCGFGLIGKFVQPIDNGLNMVITAGMHTGCTKLLVRKDSGIKTVADLKGKKIGVSSLAGSEAVTAKRYLYSNGFDISADSKDIEFLVYSTTDQPIALQNGAVDAICTPDPIATQAEKEYDLLPLLDTAVTEPYASEYCCVTFVSQELADKHPDVAAKFTDACLKASAWVAENPEETAKTVGGHGGMDFIMDYRLVYCLRNGLPLDMDVYDLAEWCAVSELSRISLENHSAPVEVPDFTRGGQDKIKGFSYAFAN